MKATDKIKDPPPSLGHVHTHTHTHTHTTRTTTDILKSCWFKNIPIVSSSSSSKLTLAGIVWHHQDCLIWTLGQHESVWEAKLAITSGFIDVHIS